MINRPASGAVVVPVKVSRMTGDTLAAVRNRRAGQYSRDIAVTGEAVICRMDTGQQV